MKKIRIGIAGLGRMGQIHLRNIHRYFPEAEVTAVVDKVKQHAEKIAVEFHINTVPDSFEEMVESQEIDAVVISSPTDTHAMYIEMAASAGRDIFCEKPFDLSLSKTRNAHVKAEQAGVKLMTGFNRRFDPEFQKIKTMVDSGSIGKTEIIKITSRDPAPPSIEFIASSGGLFADMTIHDFDMARYISGTEVKEVYAVGKVMVDKAIGELGDIDTAITTLTFEDDTLAVIDNSRRAVYGYDQRLEVFGSKGMVQAGNMLHDTHCLTDVNGIHGALPLDFFMDRYATSYLNEIEVFIRLLQKGEEAPVTGHDCLMAIAIAQAANASVKENRPVRLTEII